MRNTIITYLAVFFSLSLVYLQIALPIYSLQNDIAILINEEENEIEVNRTLMEELNKLLSTQILYAKYAIQIMDLTLYIPFLSQQHIQAVLTPPPDLN